MAKSELTKTDLEQLLDEQTRVILGAVDEKLTATNNSVNDRFNKIEFSINRLDEKFTKKFDQILTLLDKSAKQWSELKQEFDILKSEMQTIKEVLKSKFQIDIDAIRHA